MTSVNYTDFKLEDRQEQNIFLVLQTQQNIQNFILWIYKATRVWK